MAAHIKNSFYSRGQKMPINVVKKGAKSWPLFIFVLFLLQFQYKLKKA